MNPIFYIDFYKVGHVSQYPNDTEYVYSNWTPRSSRVEDCDGVIFFGLSYFIQKYLIKEFKTFFNTPWEMVQQEYRAVIRNTLGVNEPKTDHLQALHSLGYLPLKIYALPEGTLVPLNMPAMVLVNTDPRFFWLPNYLETLLSCILWKPSTSATTARRYRKIFEKYAHMAGETDLAFTNWQGHDFSFRGMSGVEDAVLSGMGHLTQFNGTDTIPAILTAKQYYGADLNVGGSVPATEHSVMCAGYKDGEFETFKRLLTEVYPSGIVSVVSDTWDLWKVLTDYIPRLKDIILARDGKLVIRPDSGDPIKILCGDPSATGPARKGAIRLLAEALGCEERQGKLPLINKAGVIYGDSITPARAEAILDRCVNELGMSPYNCVFGIGSFTYEFTTRDAYGFAMKATAVQRAGRLIPIFKDPVTDDGLKKSHYGIPSVFWKANFSGLELQQDSTPDELANCAFETVFENGRQLVQPSFASIRAAAGHGDYKFSPIKFSPTNSVEVSA